MTERYVHTAPPATPYQTEVALHVIEECQEVSQRLTKLLRFGPTETQAGQVYDNAYRVGHEVGNLLEVIDMGIAAGIISRDAIEPGRREKRIKFAKYTKQTETKPE